MNEQQMPAQVSVPDAVRDLLARNPAALASLLQHIADQTGDGRIARAAGIVRGKPAGRRALDDSALLNSVRQMVAEGYTLGEALKSAAAAHPGHSFESTQARLRRKWNRREQNTLRLVKQ
jgi:hypothetical protein